MGASFAGIIVFKQMQELAAKEARTDCGVIEVNKNEAFSDYLKPPEESLDLLSCFCFNQFKTIA